MNRLSVHSPFTIALASGSFVTLLALASCGDAKPAAVDSSTRPRPTGTTTAPPPPTSTTPSFTPDAGACVMCGGACVDLKSDALNCGGCGHTCVGTVAPDHASATCTVGACGFKCHEGYEISGGNQCVRSIVAPRPLAPLSTARVTQRPLLRWQLAATTDGAQLELCPTRACDHGVTSYEVSGDRFSPPDGLAPGAHFWRLRGRAARQSGTRVSATWEFFVGHQPAPHASSWGTVADFNGDGYADVVVADPGAGKIYVYWGGPNGVDPSDPSRTTLSVPTTAFFTVSNGGDLDGDGFPELVVGADGANKVYVYKGGISGLPSTPSFTLSSPYATVAGQEAKFGAAIASAGDQNGDGYSDLVVGACGQERVLIYAGSAAGVTDTARTELAAPTPGSGFGCAVAGAGDIDGDGYTDLVVGAPKANSGTGAVHVYYGGPAEISRAPSQTILGPDVAQGGFGQSLAIAGDINADGFADLIVGAPASNMGSGRVYVLHGSRNGLPLEPSSAIDGPDGRGALFGAVVVAGGDVNGDGFDDVLVSSPGITAANALGKVHAYHGSATGLTTSTSTTIVGPDGGSFGTSIAIGDFDGDGFVDLLVGTMSANRTYIYRGAAAGFGSLPTTVIRAPESASSTFGRSVALLVRRLGAWRVG